MFAGSRLLLPVSTNFATEWIIKSFSTDLFKISLYECFIELFTADLFKNTD